MYLFPCDENYEKMFPDVLIIGFKTNENLKLYLVRPFLPCVNEECRPKPEGGKRFDRKQGLVSNRIVITSTSFVLELTAVKAHTSITMTIKPNA